MRERRKRHPLSGPIEESVLSAVRLCHHGTGRAGAARARARTGGSARSEHVHLGTEPQDVAHGGLDGANPMVADGLDSNLLYFPVGL